MPTQRPEVPSNATPGAPPLIPDAAREVAASLPLPEGDIGGLFSLALSEIATPEDVTEHLTSHPRMGAHDVHTG